MPKLPRLDLADFSDLLDNPKELLLLQELMGSIMPEQLRQSLLGDASVSIPALVEQTVKLDSMFERMNADHIKLVANRFVAGNKVTRVAEAQKAILQTLKSEKALTAMLENCTDLERAALDYVALRGSPVNGWEVVAQLARLGFTAPKMNTSVPYFRGNLSNQVGVRLIGLLLRDCLLIPQSSSASWFSQSYYYGSNTATNSEADLLFVDARILAALKKLPPVTPLQAKPLELTTVKGNLIFTHPAKVLLELSEVMNLVLEDGLVSTTKDGKISKAVFSKFAKRRVWLASRLEFYLNGLQTLGFLKPTTDGLKPNIQNWSAFLMLPLELRYANCLELYLTAPFKTEQNYLSRPVGIPNVMAARQGLLACLPLLPDDPVALEPALKAMFERVLRYFSGESDGYSYRDPKPVTAVPGFFKHEIIGRLHEIGLVAFETKGSKDKPEYVIARGVGAKWIGQFAQGAPNPNLKPQASLLVQANFDVLVYLDQLSAFAIAALSCADCQRIDAQTAMYTISRASVYRALETGLSVQTILEMLTIYSSTPLPSNVRSSIQEWSGRRERLSLTEKTTLLEYHDSKERDAALKLSSGARAVGERFMLVEVIPKNTIVHRYSGTPNRTIVFQADGTFKLEGGADLAARAMMSSLAIPLKAGVYGLNRQAVQAGAFNASYREAFSARVKGNIPRHFEALLTLWEGKIGKPSLVPTTLFQHELANSLATHPSLEAHLATQLNSTTYLVKAGSEKSLQEALKALGIEAGAALRANLTATSSQSLNPLQIGLNTRKMREMIELAIAQNRSLEIKYDEEKTVYGNYGYPEKTRGKIKHEKIKPTDVSYAASTPYFSGKTLEGAKERTIRIGYIHAIGVI